MNYISLFSSAGIGCSAFSDKGFTCLSTLEIDNKRIEIQKINNKCSDEKYYVCGDITDKRIKEKLFSNIENKIIDLVVATPPCQSFSTLNKKNANEINRNSLVVESLNIIDKIRPKYFVIENVRNFLKSTCQYLDNEIEIEKAINVILASNYNIMYRQINFSDYGTNSSRPRTLVIGTRKDLSWTSPIYLWPKKENGKNLRDTLIDFEPLNIMGEVSKNNPLHSFRKYDVRMLPWIENLAEGQSAFEQIEDFRIPHKIVDGKIVYNKNKMTNKYKRLCWDKVAPCVHTRNDILASQNTIHPTENRVLSVAEIMKLLNVPNKFQFSRINLHSCTEKEYKSIENMARKMLGESVPYNIFENIANNILYVEKVLYEIEKIEEIENPNTIEGKIRKFELENANRNKNDAFFTTPSIVFDLISTISEPDKIQSILEPSAGHGIFIPQIKKYFGDDIDITVVDIDPESTRFLSKNFENIVVKNMDFTLFSTNEKYDLIIGNPPYGKIKSQSLINIFLEKSLSIANTVVMLLPKYFCNSSVFKNTRINYSSRVNYVIDYPFNVTDAKIELIGISYGNKKVSSFTVKDKDGNITLRNKDYCFINSLYILYGSKEFYKFYESLEIDFFDYYRNRTLTNSYLAEKGDVFVVKSKNIVQDSIINIKGYDKYTSTENVPSFIEENKELYVIPNFTYNFRIAQLREKFAVNGSVIVLKPKKATSISFVEKLNSKEYLSYYNHIMNFSKFTLNLNEDIIKLLGIPKENFNED